MKRIKSENGAHVTNVNQRDDIVMRQLAQVHYIASHNRKRLPPHIEIGDLHETLRVFALCQGAALGPVHEFSRESRTYRSLNRVSNSLTSAGKRDQATAISLECRFIGVDRE